MKIEVKFFATLRLSLGVASISLKIENPITVDELIDILEERFKGKKIREKLIDKGRIKPGTMILINGKNILHLNGLNTKIEEGTVSIFPPAGGG